MSDLLIQLKEKIKEILPRVSQVIGYQQGFDLLHVTPLFIRQAADVERFIWNRFCIPNLANYLAPQKQLLSPPLKEGEKIGIVLKGCDSQSVNQLLQEGVIKREQLFIIGLPCEGKIDLRKLKQNFDLERVQGIQVDNQTVLLLTDKGDFPVDLNGLLYDKCLACEHPNPLREDVSVGRRITEKRDGKRLYQPVIELEKLSPADLRAFWQKHFARCIRCYACRNSCPMCYCQNQCLIETRRPHWVSQAVAPKENEFFHIMRALHLAGRCTDCGECARVCPMDIPLDLLNRKTNQDLLRLFDYQAGLNPEIKPPLMTFKLEEDWEKV